MNIKLYSANCTGVETNCRYPHETVVADEASLLSAVARDYVCVAYKDNYRSKDNFLSTTCLGMDCDNDHSDDPNDWVSPEQIRSQFPDVTFAVHYSRHNMISKYGKTPRPKFHVLFLIEEMTDAQAYSDLKKRMNVLFPYFDQKALDSARFFYGTKDPQAAFFPGTITLNECLDLYYPDVAEDDGWDMGTPSDNHVIPEGSRNATLSHYAGRVLKRLGDTPDAYNKYLIEAAKCDPPLEEQELETIWRSAQGFFKRISQEDGYIAPDKYGAGDPLRPEFLTDVDEAHVLADVYGGVLRHSMATEFLVYDGKVWTESTAKAHSVMHELTRRQIAEHAQDYAEAKSALADAQAVYDRARSVRKKDGADDGQETPKAQANAALKKAEGAFHAEESYREFLLKCRNSGKIRGILEEAKACLEIDVADLDSDPFLLNTPGGEVNLRTGELLPHDPEHFHTRMTTASPSMEGMKLWLDFLGVITCGDKELEYYLQMTSGEELIGRIFNENMRIKIGEGSNGKSTYTNSKLRIMGTYGGQISAETLTTGAKNGKNWELAEMRGKRLVVASELEEGMRLNTAFVKKICSTDAILGEKKNKDPFSFIPSHTVVLYTNHLPKVGSIDKGTWRRLTVIPFNAVIEGKSDIKNYSEYLIEHSGGAILQWMVDGAKAFIASDYRITAPECVRRAIDAYQEQNDWLSGFLSECCELDPNYTARSGELYQVYRRYCDSIGEFKRSPQDFKSAILKDRIAAHKITTRKTKTGSIIQGLRIKVPDAEDEFPEFLK